MNNSFVISDYNNSGWGFSISNMSWTANGIEFDVVFN